MNRFLRLSSLLIISFAACSQPYKQLKELHGKQRSALMYKPQYDKELYRCTVNGRIIFKNFHISGILFFKKVETGTVHAVFQNEMGYTFLDFEWNKDDSFKVVQIIPQLDRPALVKTLKKDFSLLLMKGLDSKTEHFYSNDGGKTVYSCFTLENGVVYYISGNNKLQRIENAGKRKKVTTISIASKKTDDAMPDTVFFNHHKANFTIALHKLERHVDE